MEIIRNPVINLMLDSAASEILERTKHAYTHVNPAVRFAYPFSDGIKLLHEIHKIKDGNEGLNYVVARNPETLECLPISMPALRQNNSGSPDIPLPAINLGRENLIKLNEISRFGNYERTYDAIIGGLTILDQYQQANDKGYTQVVVQDAPDNDHATRAMGFSFSALYGKPNP